MSEDSKVKDIINATKGVIEALPAKEVYENGLQPYVKTLGTVGKTIYSVLIPFRMFVTTIERLETWMMPKLEGKMKNVPPERIQKPQPYIAVPTMLALSYNADQETLREMYLNLLVTAMDAETAHYAHPSFAEILKQMTPDEAKIINLFSETDSYPVININGHTLDSDGYIIHLCNFSLLGELSNCDHLNLVPSYIDNLCRLGLTYFPGFYGKEMSDKDAYVGLVNHPVVKDLKHSIEHEYHQRFEVNNRVLIRTQFGEQFIKACVIEHEPQNTSLPEQN